jgi:hypothetical protein
MALDTGMEFELDAIALEPSVEVKFQFADGYEVGFEVVFAAQGRYVTAAV